MQIQPHQDFQTLLINLVHEINWGQPTMVPALYLCHCSIQEMRPEHPLHAEHPLESRAQRRIKEVQTLSPGSWSPEE